MKGYGLRTGLQRGRRRPVAGRRFGRRAGPRVRALKQDHPREVQQLAWFGLGRGLGLGLVSGSG